MKKTLLLFPLFTFTILGCDTEPNSHRVGDLLVSPNAQSTASNETVAQTTSALRSVGLSWGDYSHKLSDGELVHNKMHFYSNTCTGEFGPTQGAGDGEGADNVFKLLVANASDTSFDVELVAAIDLGPGLEAGTVFNSTHCDYTFASFYRCENKISEFRTGDFGLPATDAVITQTVRESGLAIGASSAIRNIRNRFECEGTECDDAFAIIETNPGPGASYPCNWRDVSTYDVQ